MGAGGVVVDVEASIFKELEKGRGEGKGKGKGKSGRVC